MRARRSALSVPGSSERMLAKAAALPADEIVFDLEDAVALPAKDEARGLVARLLREGLGAARAVAVRVNGLDSGCCHCDVLELVEQAGPKIDSLVLPKVECAEDLRWLDRFLGMLGERASGHPAPGARGDRRWPPAGRRDRHSQPPPRCRHPGLCRPRGVAGPAGPRQPAGALAVRPGVRARGARAAGLQAVDGPFLAVRDEEGLRSRAEHARALGFDGKWAVHPDQVPVLNEVFTPSADEVERARAIVSALECEGRGAVEVDGQMVDAASRKLALQVLARAEAARSGQ